MHSVVIRSFDSMYDPRTRAIREAFLSKSYKCLVLDWSSDTPPGGVVRFSRQRKFGQGHKQWTDYLRFNLWLYKYLSKEKPKIVVCVDTETFFGPIFYKLISAVKRQRITFLLDVADSLASKTPIRLIKVATTYIEKLAFALSDFVVFPSVKRLPRNYKSKFRVIENVFLSAQLISELRLLKKRKNSIFYGGLLLKDRGIDLLLNLAKEPALQVIIAGYGELEESVIEVAAKNPNVIFLGKLQFGEIASLRAQSEFSWCWYEQSFLGNLNHASGKILESIQLGSVPITNVSPNSLSYQGRTLENMVLFVTEESLVEQVSKFSEQDLVDESLPPIHTTQERYTLLLGEICG